MKKSKKKKKVTFGKLNNIEINISKKSKTLGYRSRAAFKLIELNKNLNLFKKNSYLLILEYPGGWAQVVSQIITTGKIMSIDLKK